MEQFINSYKQMWVRWNDFSGKTDRGDFWRAVLVNFIIAFVIGLVPVVRLLAGIYGLAVIVPALAMGWRRMHDTGNAGWFILIPIVNLIFACMESK